MPEFSIRPIADQDRALVSQLLTGRWGAALMITRGRRHVADQLPGLIAFQDQKPAGLITYRIEQTDCEVVSLDSYIEGIGIGTALISAVRQIAKQAQCKRLWLITTNDNLDALGFYQKRGFHLVAVHANALAESRKLKPVIPMIGKDGIPLRDEIELEITLGPSGATGLALDKNPS